MRTSYRRAKLIAYTHMRVGANENNDCYTLDMNIFKSTTFTWWQLGMLKWTVLFIGLVIGALWPTYIIPFVPVLLVVAAVETIYLIIVWRNN
jgi:hypothetical protein